MLTRSGRTVAITSLGLLSAGILLGVSELRLAGIAGLLLALVAIAWVNLAVVKVQVTRTVLPTRVHKGSLSTVELIVRNLSRRRTPVLQLRDVTRHLHADSPGNQSSSGTLDVVPLRSGEWVRVSYPLQCERRGITRIGPLEVMLTDPFNLALRCVMREEPSELIVWPALRNLSASLHPPQADEGTHLKPSAASFAGNDLVGLRPYRIGDDLRHVHWLASARNDDLIIRELEVPSDELITLIVDARASTHNPASFERALEAATSIAVECSRSETRLRLMITSNPSHPELFDSGIGHGSNFCSRLLDQLAVAEVNPNSILSETIDEIVLAIASTHERSATPSVVVIGGDSSDVFRLIDELGGVARGWVGLPFSDEPGLAPDSLTASPNPIYLDPNFKRSPK